MLRHSPKPVLRRATRTLAAGLVLGMIFGLVAGCQPSAPAQTQANTVLGVGATFPAPLYTRWAQDWRPVSGVAVNYQGIGSGGGIKQILAKTVDFGASDKPLPPDLLESAGLYQFPTVVGGVTPIINLPGVGPGQLKLTGAVLGNIFLGTVARWNDPQIAALNPGLKLPADKIAVVHRSDGSGTTFLFTAYLSLVNPTWKAKVGANDALAWPTGMASKGNGGVAVSVKQTEGSIGYVEYAYAKQANLAWVQLQDHDGAFIAPTPQGFAAAAADADWAGSPGNNVLLLNQPGAGSWPITGATFILIYKQPPKPPKTRQVLAFFDWGFKTGDATAISLDYVPLPQSVKDLIRKQWATTIKDANGQPLYPPGS
jgi:phosphate transport system substrate-binding protein